MNCHYSGLWKEDRSFTTYANLGRFSVLLITLPPTPLHLDIYLGTYGFGRENNENPTSFITLRACISCKREHALDGVLFLPWTDWSLSKLGKAPLLRPSEEPKGRATCNVSTLMQFQAAGPGQRSFLELQFNMFQRGCFCSAWKSSTSCRLQPGSAIPSMQPSLLSGIIRKGSRTPVQRASTTQEAKTDPTDLTVPSHSFTAPSLDQKSSRLK